MKAAKNVEILSKKGKGQNISTIPTPLNRKIGKKMKWRPNSVPLEPKNWLNSVDEWESITEAVSQRLLRYLGLFLEP